MKERGEDLVAFNEEVQYAQFVMGDHSSLDFGIQIKYPFTLSHPTMDVSAVSIPGHSGDLLSRNHRFNNFTQTINLYVRKPPGYDTWSRLAADINNWLIGDTYQLFYLSNLREWVLEAYLTQPLALEPQNDLEASGSITLNCKPYMKREDGLNFIPLNSALPIVNTEVETAEPTFHIVGKGDIRLSVNGDNYYFNNIEDEIYIDSEQEWIYRHNFNENMAMHAVFPNNNFPTFHPGDNGVFIFGNYSKVEYKANWRRLV